MLSYPTVKAEVNDLAFSLNIQTIYRIYFSGTGGTVFMSDTDTLGHQDVHGLSATDPRLRQWI